MNQQLLERLTSELKPTPWYLKNNRIFWIWASLSILYVTLLSLFSEVSLSNLEPLAAIALLFTLTLSFLLLRQRLKAMTGPWGPSLILFLLPLMTLLLSTFFLPSIGFSRSAQLSSGDVDCLSHALLGACLLVALSFFVIRHYFIAQPVSITLCLSSFTGGLILLWLEMCCQDREFWHLLNGHQSSLLVILCSVLLIFRGLRVKKM